jgi:peptidyl-dipeptidase A
LIFQIDLLDSYEDNDANNINALYLMALERVAFLPFGMLIDKWRWDVFSGAVEEPQWNSKWWEYRERYQKIESPVPRTESDFDPGAKYHVPANSQYIAYAKIHRNILNEFSNFF